MGIHARIAKQKQEAVEKALDSLSRYKFLMFGYWAGVWVHLNQIDDRKEPNPFKHLVTESRYLLVAMKQDSEIAKGTGS
jgi:hypothetical protein